MQFDHTYIAIRKRSLLEILDLSLHVIRDHFIPLMTLWLIGCLPFLIFNWYFLSWLSLDYYDPENLWLFVYLMTVAVYLQSQFSSLFVTNYLGMSMFSENPTVWQAVKSSFASNKYLLWVHGALRLMIPVMVLIAFLNERVSGESQGLIVFWISLLAFIGLIVRAARPFATEILCLEKTPVFKSKSGQVNYSRRSKSLHSAANTELSGRFFMTALFSIPLVVLILGSLLTIDSALSLHPKSDSLASVFYLPISLWIVSGFLAVVRFMSYIDIRIRQEGWEVELRLRAEAIKLGKAIG